MCPNMYNLTNKKLSTLTGELSKVGGAGCQGTGPQIWCSCVVKAVLTVCYGDPGNWIWRGTYRLYPGKGMEATMGLINKEIIKQM